MRTSDKSPPPLLSQAKGMGLTPRKRSPAEEAFTHIANHNPLKMLTPDDKVGLWALLQVYVMSRRKTGRTNDLEQVSILADQAKKLADNMESLLFSGPLSAVFSEIMASYEKFPALLVKFSTDLESLTEILGKPGQKSKVFSNMLLIMASEFVKRKTDSYNDEYLAELIQPCLDESMIEDLSGEAIRKRRKHLAKVYRRAYDFVEAAAKSY